MSLVSIESLYRNALLSQAAYVEFNGRDVNSDSWLAEVYQQSGLSAQNYNAGRRDEGTPRKNLPRQENQNDLTCAQWRRYGGRGA